MTLKLKFAIDTKVKDKTMLHEAIHWNSANGVVQDHRDGTIYEDETNLVRQALGLAVPWTKHSGLIKTELLYRTKIRFERDFMKDFPKDLQKLDYESIFIGYMINTGIVDIRESVDGESFVMEADILTDTSPRSHASKIVRVVSEYR